MRRNKDDKFRISVSIFIGLNVILFLNFNIEVKQEKSRKMKGGTVGVLEKQKKGDDDLKNGVL